MLHDWLHRYGHLALYLAGIGGSLCILAVVLFAGRYYRPSKKERARRRSREARDKVFSRRNALVPREASRGELPPARSQELRPKTMPFAPGGGSPLKTQKSAPTTATIVPFSPATSPLPPPPPPPGAENKGIRTPLAPTPPDLKQGEP